MPTGPPEERIGIDASEAALQHLQLELRVLRTYATGTVLPAQAVINPLLDVWEPARRIHPWVALPVERLLTTLVSRTTVAVDEIGEVADEVALLALEMRSLSESAAAR